MGKLIKNILSDDAFWLVNKQIAKVVGLDAALLLSDLISKDAYFKKKDKKYKGWFFNTSQNIEKDTTLSYFKQKNALKILKDWEMIDTKVKGVPAKLNFKIKDKAILKVLKTSIREIRILELEKFENLYSRNSKTINKNKVNKNKTNNKDISPSPSKSTTKERNIKYLPLAKELAKIIQTKKEVKTTSTQIIGWTNEFRQLEESNKVSIHRMEAVMKWYKQNIGGNYIPVVESGSSFRSKFIKLEDAINRQENPIKNNNQQAPRNGYTNDKEMEKLREYEKNNTITL